MEKSFFVIATLVNDEWFYIHQQTHYDYSDTYSPTNSIFVATRFDTKEKAKHSLKDVLQGVRYFERDIFSNHPSIQKDVWKVFKCQLVPSLTEEE